MEFLLLWWDDLDDLTHACRHLATSAFSELAEATYAVAPLLATVFTTLSAMGAYLLLHVQS